MTQEATTSGSSPLEEVLRAQQQGDSANQAAQQKLVELREQIVTGTYSTGNKNRDFLIAAYGMMEQPELEAKIQSLSDAVEAHRGEQVLLVGEMYEKDGEDGCFSSSYYLCKGRYLQLGVATESMGFNLSDKQLIIPTGKKVTWGSNAMGLYFSDSFSENDNPWKLTESPLSINGDNFLDPKIGFDRGYSRFDVLVGNKNVELYFKLRHAFNKDTIDHILTGYEYPSGIPFPQHWLDLSYVKALELLGLDVPSEFRIAFDQRSDERQKVLFQEIYELGEPAKDTADAETLRQKLAYAVEVGIHLKTLTISGPRMGTTAFSTQILPALCRHYDVAMPEKK